MPKQPITPPRSQRPEPPIKDPQPYKDPVSPPPGDPPEQRPMQDPTPPDRDRPQS